jgi:plastocyanin
VNRSLRLVALGLIALAPACRPSTESGSTPPATPSTSSAPTPAATPPRAKAAPVGRGFIEGVARLVGTPPTPALLDTSPTVTSVCGEKVPDRSLTVGEGGALAHVVVSLAEGAALPAEGVTAPAGVLDQKKCSYEPPALAARAGTALEVRNSDPVMHNVRAVAGAQSVFNVAMPLEGMSLRKPLPAAPGTLQVKCDVHPWMRAVVRTFDHPYFTTTDAQGRFRLEVPEGTHTVQLWHDRLPEASRPVTVKAGETVRLEQSWEVGALR